MIKKRKTIKEYADPTVDFYKKRNMLAGKGPKVPDSYFKRLSKKRKPLPDDYTPPEQFADAFDMRGDAEFAFDSSDIYQTTDNRTHLTKEIYYALDNYFKLSDKDPSLLSYSAYDAYMLWENISVNDKIYFMLLYLMYPIGLNEAEVEALMFKINISKLNDIEDLKKVARSFANIKNN